MSLFSKKSSSDMSQPRRRRSLGDDQLKASGDRHTSAYARGRTLAGSTSHTLRAAETRAISNATPREKVHHLTSLRRKLSWVLSLSLIAIIALLAFLYQFTASAAVNFNSEAAAQNPAPYEDVVQEYLTQNPLERLRFNMNVDKLNTFVLSKLPDVKRVTPTGYTGPVSSGFEVELRKPVVSWQVEDDLYFVDANGVSFTKNAYSNPRVTIVDNSGVQYTSGTAIASARFLTFVGKAVALAEERNLPVESVAIPAGTSRQVELFIVGHAYPVIMSIDRSAGEQSEDMQRALAYFDKNGRKPQYIDLRVKGKAFFRE